ncbi:MAG: hypothetical protein RLZZ618_3176 [Pseudomonadota bacterium]|jgi:hypothetical protein
MASPLPPRHHNVFIGLVLLMWPLFGWFLCEAYTPLGRQLSLGGGLLLFLVSMASELTAAVLLGISLLLCGKDGRPYTLGIIATAPRAALVAAGVAVLVHLVLVTMLSCSLGSECARGI